MPSNPAPSEIPDETREFAHRFVAAVSSIGQRLNNAMLDMILNQGALGIAQRVFDSLDLLRQIGAATIGLDHFEYGCQMPVSLFEAQGDLLVIRRTHMPPIP